MVPQAQLSVLARAQTRQAIASPDEAARRSPSERTVVLSVSLRRAPEEEQMPSCSGKLLNPHCASHLLRCAAPAPGHAPKAWQTAFGHAGRRADTAGLRQQAQGSEGQGIAACDSCYQLCGAGCGVAPLEPGQARIPTLLQGRCKTTMLAMQPSAPSLRYERLPILGLPPTWHARRPPSKAPTSG